MNNDVVDDLKQFIAATVSQTEQRLRDEITQAKQELRGEIAELRSEMADGFAGSSEAIETINDQATEADKRLTKLEQQAA